jgi:hypothetical protein
VLLRDGVEIARVVRPVEARDLHPLDAPLRMTLESQLSA